MLRMRFHLTRPQLRWGVRRPEAQPQREDSVRYLLLCGAAAVVALSACRERAPLRAPASGPWLTLMNNGRALVSLDTTGLETLEGGRARVHLRYAFDSPVEAPSPSGGAPVRIFTLESIEVTECEHGTTRAMSAVLFDSAGQSLGPATNRPGAAPPSMIGKAGPRLCAYLRQLKIVPPAA